MIIHRVDVIDATGEAFRQLRGQLETARHRRQQIVPRHRPPVAILQLRIPLLQPLPSRSMRRRRPAPQKAREKAEKRALRASSGFDLPLFSGASSGACEKANRAETSCGVNGGAASLVATRLRSTQLSQRGSSLRLLRTRHVKPPTHPYVPAGAFARTLPVRDSLTPRSRPKRNMLVWLVLLNCTPYSARNHHSRNCLVSPP